MAFDEKTRQAAIRLGQALSGKPWFSSAGIGEESGRPVLIIYLRRLPPKAERTFPQSYEGIPVRAQYLGKLVPAQPSTSTKTVLREQEATYQTPGVTEGIVEDAALSWLGELEYSILHGPESAPGELAAERTSFCGTVLGERLRTALRKLNPALPTEALDEAFRKVTVPQHPSLIANNRAFHRMLVDGISVQCRMPATFPSPRGRRTKGESEADVPTELRYEIVRLIDFDVPESNDWLAVNQFTVIEGQHNRRPDIVIFVNGLPLALIELKNAADENADIWSAFN